MLSPAYVVCFARMGILQRGCRRIYAGSKLLSWGKYIFLLHNQIHLSSPRSSTTYSPQAIKHIFLIIINFFRVPAHFAFSICYSYNCCPKLLLEYTSTIRHSFSTLESIYTTFPSSNCIILSTCNEARLFFTSNNYFGCQFYGLYEYRKFFDSSIPIHAKEA